MNRITKYLPAFFRDSRTIQIIAQIAFIVVSLIVLLTLCNNIWSSLAKIDRIPEFTFLTDKAGFELSDAGTYTPEDPYWRAFMVGVINTLRVVSLGLILSTVLGVFAGIFLLSGNWIVRNITKTLVEILRNTPLLVQLFVWYFLIMTGFPAVRLAIEIPSGGLFVFPIRWLIFLIGLPLVVWYTRRLPYDSVSRTFFPVVALFVGLLMEWAKILSQPLFRIETEPFIFLSAKGIAFPAVLPTDQIGPWLLIVVIGIILSVIVHFALKRQTEKTGQKYPRTRISLLVVLLAMAVGWVLVAPNGVPMTLSVPQRQGLRLIDGTTLLPEYGALMLGLAVYTAAFIAEIVRAGIQAVPYGQIEAGRALGLTYGDTLQRVILPQALRVIIPPLGNQYLNLAKNSSLAIAISFTDLFQVSNTIINQSNQSVPGFLLIMAAYLVLSLVISAVMNIFNKRFQLVTR